MIACLPCAAADPESRGARLRAWARRVAAAALRLVRRRPRSNLGPRWLAHQEERLGLREPGFTSRTR